MSPIPADGAIGVALDQSDVDFPNRLFFNWSDGAGDPGATYTLNLDTVNSPVANSFERFPNGDFIFNLSYDTTYFWWVDSTNCAGTSTSMVWSFTTETDPALSIDDNEAGSFSIFPNAATEIINIIAATDIDTIQINNLLGQEVWTLKQDEIFDSQVNISELKSGLYLIRLSSGSKAKILRFTKK